MISSSTREVEGGVHLVAQTGEGLQRLAAQVAALDILVRDISAAAQEQATALGEVNTATNQMDQVVQQNSGMAADSATAAHALKAKANKLANLVKRFKLAEEAAPASARARDPARMPSRPAPARIARAGGA